MSRLKTSPSARRRPDGIPWMISSFTEVHRQQGYPRYPLNAGRAPSSARRFSTCFSSSSVEIPGRTRSRISSRISLAIRPLRRSRSISAGDLQMIMILDKRPDLTGDSFRLSVAVDAVKIRPMPVVINQRLCLLLVSSLPLPNRLFIVVRPVDQRATVDVADSLLFRRLEVGVVDFAAQRARQPARRALDQ